MKSAQQSKARFHVIVHGIVPDVPSGRDGVTIGGCRTFSLILRTNSVPVSLSFVYFPINGDVRVGGQALAQTSVKIICFRALPTLIVRKPHATTPFRTTGLAGQSWPNKLSIGRPSFRGITPKAPTTNAASFQLGQCTLNRPLKEDSYSYGMGFWTRGCIFF